MMPPRMSSFESREKTHTSYSTNAGDHAMFESVTFLYVHGIKQGLN